MLKVCEECGGNMIRPGKTLARCERCDTTVRLWALAGPDWRVEVIGATLTCERRWPMLSRVDEWRVASVTEFATTALAVVIGQEFMRRQGQVQTILPN